MERQSSRCRLTSGYGLVLERKGQGQPRGRFGEVMVKCGLRFTFAWFVMVTVFVLSPMCMVPHLKGIEAPSFAYTVLSPAIVNVTVPFWEDDWLRFPKATPKTTETAMAKANIKTISLLLFIFSMRPPAKP